MIRPAPQQKYKGALDRVLKVPPADVCWHDRPETKLGAFAEAGSNLGFALCSHHCNSLLEL